jgi:DNA (cytosine-5)-methyltransferase 1
MRVGSLFSGIGGLELGLERAGMQVVWQVEFDPFCQEILQKHWPEAKRYGDIRELRGDELEPVDLICGGFPCQPHSLAGQRRASDDDRDLWPEMLRIICAVKPRWVLAENVPGLLSSEAGRFFGGILRDLAESGYSVGWDCIPASAVGAPHKRERIFIIGCADVAHTDAIGRRRRAGVRGEERQREFEDGGGVGHSDGKYAIQNERLGNWSDAKPGRVCEGHDRHRRSTESRLGRVLDGLSGGLDAIGRRWPTGPGQKQHDWEPPRVIPNSPNRAKRLKALGNAVVPQVAELIGRAIMEECDG